MDPIGKRYFQAKQAHSELEMETSDALLTCCGIDPDDSDKPVTDVTFDDYDLSFEFKDVKPEWIPTKEQLTACLALGFLRCWICYTDRVEIYFDGSEIHRIERSH